MLDMNFILSNLGLGGLVVVLSFNFISQSLIKFVLPVLVEIKQDNKEIKNLIKDALRR